MKRVMLLAKVQRDSNAKIVNIICMPTDVY
jgi:hypothetical protein